MNPAALRAMRAAAVGDGADIVFNGDKVYVDYDATKDEFVVKVNPLESDRVRLVMGARHHRASDTWRMPATRSQAYGLSGVFHGRLDSTDAAKAHVAQLGTTPYPTLNLGDHLYDFQRDGVKFLASAGSSILADDMGTGKTIQAIEWMRIMDINDYHLVVCPNSMKFKWEKEINKWWPQADTFVIDGDAKARKAIMQKAADGPRPAVLIINYDALRIHSRLFPWNGRTLTEKQKEPKELNDFNWGCVVLDEAHKIKDPKALQTMAAKQMGSQAQYRLAMTGTPILESPDDVWSIHNFVEPREAGSRNQFRNRYCIMSLGWHNGYENTGLRPETLPEFDAWFQRRFIRRTKKQVLPQLPEKMPIEYRILPMSTKQQKVYNALVKDMMVNLDDNLLAAENPLSLMIRLRQTACAVPVLNDEGDVTGLTTPSNKLDAIVDILEGSPGEPLVVYAESRKFVELLEEQLTKRNYRVGMVTGAVSPFQREKAINAFQEGKLDVILGTLGAGAEGITLTRANRIVLAQQSWSHGTNAQAIDRVHRIGQTRGVLPIVLLSAGTVDLVTQAADVNKEARLQELLRDPEWVARAMRGQI